MFDAAREKDRGIKLKSEIKKKNQKEDGKVNVIQINGKRMRRLGRVYTEQTEGWGRVRSEEERLQRREKGEEGGTKDL